MTSANQPHYEDSPPVTVQSAPTMPTAASAQYCSSSHDALRTLGFALLAAGTVSALAAIACYMYLNRGVYNPADAILLLSADGDAYFSRLTKNKEGRVGNAGLEFDKTLQRFTCAAT